MSTRKFKSNGDGLFAAAGCLWAALIIIFNIAWVAFVVWAIYSLVVWVTSK